MCLHLKPSLYVQAQNYARVFKIEINNKFLCALRSKYYYCGALVCDAAAGFTVF